MEKKKLNPRNGYYLANIDRSIWESLFNYLSSRDAIMWSNEAKLEMVITEPAREWVKLKLYLKK